MIQRLRAVEIKHACHPRVKSNVDQRQRCQCPRTQAVYAEIKNHQQDRQYNVARFAVDKKRRRGDDKKRAYHLCRGQAGIAKPEIQAGSHRRIKPKNANEYACGGPDQACPFHIAAEIQRGHKGDHRQRGERREQKTLEPQRLVRVVFGEDGKACHARASVLPHGADNRSHYREYRHAIIIAAAAASVKCVQALFGTGCAAVPAIGKLAFEVFAAARAAPALVRVLACGVAPQKLPQQCFGVPEIVIVNDPHFADIGRQLADAARQIFAAHQGGDAL
jgi:hypothetical protein